MKKIQQYEVWDGVKGPREKESVSTVSYGVSPAKEEGKEKKENII